MNAPQQQPNIPPLAALVYRSGKGCRQYAFASAEELEAWAARHPYKNETLRVMPVKDRKQLGDKWVPAAEAANYVRTAQGQNAEVSRSAPLLAQVGSTDGLCIGAQDDHQT